MKQFVYVMGFIFGLILYPFLMVALFFGLLWYLPHKLGERFLNDYKWKLDRNKYSEDMKRYRETQRQELKRAMAGLRKFTERNKTDV